MQRYSDAVQDRQGNALSGVSVLVQDEDGNSATIYSDNGVSVASNPLTTDEDGEFEFWAADGVYTLNYSGSGVEPTSEQVQLWDYRNRPVVSILDLGAVGDGVADDSAAIVAAAALGTAVYFPSGTYRCTTFSIAPAAGTLFVGEGIGKSIIRFVSATTASKVDFVTTAGDIAFERLTLYHDGPASETAQIITLEGDNIRIAACEIKSNDSASVDTVVNAFQFTNNNASNITVTDCEIHNLNRVILRSNATTGVVSTVVFSNNYIHDLGQGGVQFNFPLGSITGVRIVGNHFDTFYSGTERIYCGGASVNGMAITGNVFTGACYECIHLEEAGENIVISGNVFDADGDGVFVADNNISGTSQQPVGLTITGNVFNNAGTAGTNSGIRAVEDGSGIQSYSYLTISDNIFRGYDFGAELGYGEAAVRGNTFVSCTTGLKTNNAHPDIAGNVFDGCTTGVSALIFGGMLGRNTFKGCTTVASTAATDDSRLSMTGFVVRVESDTTIAASTTTDVSLGISTGALMYGEAKVTAYFSGTSHRQRVSTVSWASGSMTDTQLAQVGAGNIAATGFVDSAGTLAFRFTNSSTEQTMRYMVVQFDGLWTSSN